jgi:hypothetical protein
MSPSNKPRPSPIKIIGQNQCEWGKDTKNDRCPERAVGWHPNLDLRMCEHHLKATTGWGCD